MITGDTLATLRRRTGRTQADLANASPSSTVCANSPITELGSDNTDAANESVSVFLRMALPTQI